MMNARKFLIPLLLLSFYVCSAQTSSQTTYGSIRVTVIEAANSQPVPFATVFLSKTTIGGRTDVDGTIEITKIPFGTYDLIVSEVSHKPIQRNLIVTSDRPVYMTMKMVVQTLKQVEVVAKRDKRWSRQYRRFEKLFLGSDHYKSCKILNPWVLDFKSSWGNFTAENTQPLKIENNYLGYELEFDIKKALFNADNFRIAGDVRFQEMKGNDSTRRVWDANRKDIYAGSPQHFLKNVIDSSLNTVGYKVYSELSSGQEIVRGATFSDNLKGHILDVISTRNIVKPLPNGIYEIDLPGRVEIHYLRKKAQAKVYRDVAHPVSWMETKNKKLYVSKEGVVQNPGDVVVAGAMTNLKVADWLPLNYNFSETYLEEQFDSLIVKEAIVTTVPLEKPYIQTDRNYFYTGETMWLKGYMNYSIPLLRDTMSQTIYLELVDKDGKVVTTKRYPIDEGKFNGDVVFDKNFAPGLYQMKAYSAWMLNFDKKLIFTKTINVLGDKEAVRIASGYKQATDTTNNVLLTTDKLQYNRRDLITVSIDVVDSLEFPVASNLSISVTDLEQAVPPAKEKTILHNFDYDGINTVVSDSVPINHNMEYGIDFAGTFWVGKKREIGSITVFQENSKESFAMITGEDGRFGRSLTFQDTINFYVRAMNARNKKGYVKMDSLKLNPPQMDVEPLSLDVYSLDAISKSKSLRLNGATLLNEVAVKSTKIEKPKNTAVIHGHGDYQVTGDYLNDHNFTNVLQAIQSKVPGAIVNIDPPSIMFRGGSFATGGGFPLVLLDGAQVFDLNQLIDVPVRSIDFIDILRFGAAAAYGSRGANGVVAVYTKKDYVKDPTEFDKSKLQAVRWPGYTTANKFTPVDYSKSADDQKAYDYRSTIYWSPKVETDGKSPATVKFYSGDASTSYRIVVEGVTAAGLPVRAEKIIEVVTGR